MKSICMASLRWSVLPVLAGLLSSPIVLGQQPQSKAARYLFHDSHFHLTNYVQEGTPIRDFLKIMGDDVGRSMLSGIPLQQQWMYAGTGDFAPTYYTQTDAPLYYYSFIDAAIAMKYKSLKPEQQARFDPMITGFNPTDMYAADHIRRVLMTFPGVFSGIGEFSIHKEFVSSKIAGEVATLNNKALDRILEFAAEVGLPVVFHCDVDTPFPRPNQDPYIVEQLKQLGERNRETVIIWAHVGVGRVVRPVEDHVAMLNRTLLDPECQNVHFDISWDETAKYIVGSPEAIQEAADLIDRFPQRFLFGTDAVAPKSQEDYLQTYEIYAPLFAKLKPETKHLLLKGNYERIFDEGRRRARQWEAAHVLRSGLGDGRKD